MPAYERGASGREPGREPRHRAGEGASELPLPGPRMQALEEEGCYQHHRHHQPCLRQQQRQPRPPWLT